MNAKHEREHAVPDASGERLAFNVSRRRFTSAGIATPVVLGSLASKPVLAFDAACTVSGQISGNASGPGVVNCVVGNSRSYWLSADPWPSPIVKGSLPTTNGCSFTGNDPQGTLFNGFQFLASVFYYDQTSCAVTTTSSGGNKAASLYQVLASSATGTPFDLGRATVVSLLNAYSLGTTGYPVTVATIVEMFNATWNGGLYQFNTSVSWNQAQVISYLQSLYPPG